MKNYLLLLSALTIFACKPVKNEVKNYVDIDVNLNFKHTVGGISEFDRSKFITIHSHPTEVDWDSTMLNYLLEDLDVYMGRDNETGNRDLHTVSEDPNRKGYPNIEDIKKVAKESRERYAANTRLHKYESRDNSIITTYVHPLFPSGSEGTKQGWTPANADASAEFIANYIKECYGDKDGVHGEPMPKYFEVMNEPMWKLVTTTDLSTPAQIFEYHNTVAKKIREVGNNIMIGGYCAAFPDFDRDNFQRWEQRDRLFVDMSGDLMDFYTFHLYDFPVFFGKQQYRRGCNVEATFDMLEQYNMLKFNKVKPMMVTEFGCQWHTLYDRDYFPYREWLFMKAANSQLLSFMDRPDNMLITIPYIINTGSYQRHRDPSAKPNPWAILKTNENGEWKQFTDFIKFYQFWADVKGTRVDSRSANLDIQVDAYIDSTEAYIIVDNLDFEPHEVKLNFNNKHASKIKEVMVKHFHERDSIAVIDTLMFNELPEKLQLDASGTMIIKCSYQKEVNIDQTDDETKYYADKYYQEIGATKPDTFNINNVVVGKYGEAVLRIGIGRDHGKSLMPKVLFNGHEINVPANWRGDDQSQRNNFFGVREIPVPYNYLKENNEVLVTFEDEGGRISSVTMRVFNYSKRIKRSFN